MSSLFLFILLLIPCCLSAQPQDVRLSPEPVQLNVSQTSPGLVLRDGELLVVWFGPYPIDGTGFKLPTLNVSVDEPRGATTTSTSGSRGIEITRIVPNPAGSATAIEFTQSEAGDVTIEFIDAMGRRGASVDLGSHSAGHHSHGLDITGLTPGIYTTLLRAGSRSDRARLIVLH